MGNVSRFIEPVVLRILKEKKRSYGYEIAECLAQYALTDATIEGAALYRTLRTLEANGYVSSKWEAGDGPARRNYSLTPSGHVHLRDWSHLLESLGQAMIEFARIRFVFPYLLEWKGLLGAESAAAIASSLCLFVTSAAILSKTKG
jgi:DNA-binding PadR family transcriptional regulator